MEDDVSWPPRSNNRFCKWKHLLNRLSWLHREKGTNHLFGSFQVNWMMFSPPVLAPILFTLRIFISLCGCGLCWCGPSHGVSGCTSRHTTHSSGLLTVHNEDRGAGRWTAGKKSHTWWDNAFYHILEKHPIRFSSISCRGQQPSAASVGPCGSLIVET